MRDALSTCGFTNVTQLNFIVDNKGFNRWIVFTLIDFDALTIIREFTPFPISSTKLLCLAVLKFWIEDKIRMNKPHIAYQFRQDITMYINLYQTFIAAGINNDHVIYGPQFNMNDWSVFKTGTIDYLGSIQDNGGVPLSYILRNDVHHPGTTNASLRDTKILLNAPLADNNFNTDNHPVWTYLSQQCHETLGWLRIWQYQDTNDGYQVGFALSLYFGGRVEVIVAEVPEAEPSYEDNDYIYINHRDSRFEDIYNMWRRTGRCAHTLMILEIMELETIFFTSSDYQGNIHDFNMNPRIIYPEQAR